jgi:predicted HicB family RNase H-like nuclease
MKRFDDQVCLKLAGPLRATLEEEAAERGRSLSNLIRRVLTDHAAERITERAGADAGAIR